MESIFDVLKKGKQASTTTPEESVDADKPKQRNPYEEMQKWSQQEFKDPKTIDDALKTALSLPSDLPPVRVDFYNKAKGKLEDQIKEARRVAEVSKGKAETYQIAEIIGKGLLQLAAANRGLREGVDLTTGRDFKPSDWSQRFKSIQDELDSKLKVVDSQSDILAKEEGQERKDFEDNRTRVQKAIFDALNAEKTTQRTVFTQEAIGERTARTLTSQEKRQQESLAAQEKRQQDLFSHQEKLSDSREQNKRERDEILNSYNTIRDAEKRIWALDDRSFQAEQDSIRALETRLRDYYKHELNKELKDTDLANKLKLLDNNQAFKKELQTLSQDQKKELLDIKNEYDVSKQEAQFGRNKELKEIDNKYAQVMEDIRQKNRLDIKGLEHERRLEYLTKKNDTNLADKAAKTYADLLTKNNNTNAKLLTEKTAFTQKFRTLEESYNSDLIDEETYRRKIGETLSDVARTLGVDNTEIERIHKGSKDERSLFNSIKSVLGISDAAKDPEDLIKWMEQVQPVNYNQTDPRVLEAIKMASDPARSPEERREIIMKLRKKGIYI